MDFFYPLWQLQTPIYINQAKQIFDALQVNNIKNSWLSTHFQKVQFLHKYRNLPLKKSFHIFFMWFSHTKDLFSFNRNWWNDNIFEGVFTYLIFLLEQKYSRLRCLLRVKGLVFCFYLGWSSVQTKYNKGRFKVMATYLPQ